LARATICRTRRDHQTWRQYWLEAAQTYVRLLLSTEPGAMENIVRTRTDPLHCRHTSQLQVSTSCLCSDEMRTDRRTWQQQHMCIANRAWRQIMADLSLWRCKLANALNMAVFEARQRRGLCLVHPPGARCHTAKRTRRIVLFSPRTHSQDTLDKPGRPAGHTGQGYRGLSLCQTPCFVSAAGRSLAWLHNREHEVEVDNGVGRGYFRGRQKVMRPPTIHRLERERERERERLPANLLQEGKTCHTL